MATRPSRARRLPAVGTFLAAVLSAPAGLPAQQYEAPPEVLRDATDRVAADIDAAFTEENDPAAAAERLESVWPTLVFYTVADALPGDELHQIRGLRAYRYLAEATRTDKQIGASASGPGTTSLTRKPGIAELLALAVEHGAVEQTTSGTGVTLSTSPYAFVRLLEPDNAENFDRFGLWRRIGISATLEAETESPGPGGGDDDRQLAEWSLRLRVLGDRSTRSPAFTRRWMASIQPRIQERLNALSGGLAAAINGTPALRAAADTAQDGARSQVERYLTDHASVPAEQRVTEIGRIVLDALHAGVHQPVANGTIALTGETTRDITGSVARLALAHESLEQGQGELSGLLDELDRSLLLTLEYTHHAEVAGRTGFSDMRLLFEDDVAPFNLVANAFLSIHDDPDEAIGQKKVRDYGASVAVEGQVVNPFIRRPPLDLAEPITLSVAYQLSRFEEGEEMVHIVLARGNIPISTGVGLPLSLTYASRGTIVDEEHVTGNFGFSLDLDKLYALSRALAGR